MPVTLNMPPEAFGQILGMLKSQRFLHEQLLAIYCLSTPDPEGTCDDFERQITSAAMADEETPDAAFNFAINQGASEEIERVFAAVRQRIAANQEDDG